MFGIFRGTGMMGKHSARRSQSGYMVAAALASVALIAGATAMVMTSVTTASKTANKVSARAKLSSDLDSAFAFLANSGMLGVDSNGGITNMFYAPPAINASEQQAELPGIYGAVPQLQTVAPDGKLVGYVAFYNGPTENSRRIYQAFQQGQRTVPPIYINESLQTAINANNVPAMAFVAPGANGQFDLKQEADLLRAITREENGMTVLKSSNEINQYLSDNGIDDRVIARNGFDARNTQGETTTNLVQNSDPCNPVTHKLVYTPRPGGGTEFVCVPETDPALVITDGAVGTGSSILQSAPGSLNGNRTIRLRQIFGNEGVTVNGAEGSLVLGFDYTNNEGIVNRFNSLDSEINNLNTRINNLGGGGGTITADGVNLPLNASPTNRGVVFKRVANNKLEFRTIRSADANLQVQTTEDEVIIRNTAPASAVNGSNIGGVPCGGLGAAMDPDLQNMMEASGLYETYITATRAEQRQIEEAIGYEASAGVNPAQQAQTQAAAASGDPCSTAEIYAGKADAMTLRFRRLEAGLGITLSEGEADTQNFRSIKITSNPAAAGALVDVRNVGNGVALARKNGGVVEVKTLRGTGGTLIRTVGDVVEIEAPGGITTGDVNTQIANYLSANVFPGASCPAGQVLTYNASATPRLQCISAGGFWAVDSTNPAGIVPTATAVRVPNNVDFFLGDLTRSGGSVNGSGVAISGDAGSQIAGTTLISEAGLTNLANNSGVNTTATLSGGSLGLIINGVGAPGNGNSIFTASRQSMVMERRVGSNDNITYTVFNRGISMGGSGGADFFRLDIPETGNIATMRLNGQQILGMPSTECTATQVLTFRGNQLTCVENGAGGTSAGWENVPLTDTNPFDANCEYRFTGPGLQPYVGTPNWYYANAVGPDGLIYISHSGVVSHIDKASKSVYRVSGTPASGLAITNIQKRCGMLAGGGSGGSGNGLITCRSTTPQLIANNWYKFQFTAADCGGQLPDNTYTGVYKEAVAPNGEGAVTVLNSGQVFGGTGTEGWSNIPAGTTVTGPAVVMTFAGGGITNARATAVYIRSGGGSGSGSGGGSLETVTYALNETGSNGSITSVANLNNVQVMIVGNNSSNAPAANRDLLTVIPDANADVASNPLRGIVNNLPTGPMAGLSCPVGYQLTGCVGATNTQTSNADIDVYVGGNSCYADEIVRSSDRATLFVTCARGGNNTGSTPTASLPTCNAGQTLIANASGQLVCGNITPSGPMSIALSHLGGGVTLASQTAGNTSALSLKTLRQGAGISITENNGEITIANTSSGSNFLGITLGATISIGQDNTVNIARTSFPNGATKIIVQGTCTIFPNGFGSNTGQVRVDFLTSTDVLYGIDICNLRGMIENVNNAGFNSNLAVGGMQILDIPANATRVRISNQGGPTAATYRFLQ